MMALWAAQDEIYKHYLQADGASYQRFVHSWEYLWWGHLGLQSSGRERRKRRKFLQMEKNFNYLSQDSTFACSLQATRNVQRRIQE